MQSALIIIRKENMRKKLFTILTIVLGTMFMVSCGSDDNPTPVFDTATNQKVLTVMQEFYLWEPKDASLSQETKTFFGSILNDKDIYTNGEEKYRYSSISEANAPVATVYDPGFEYAINNYLDKVTYYVVLYVKPNTPASNYLARGLYITKVNGTAVTKDNAETLLPTAYSKGGDITLTIRTPMITTETTLKAFAPVANHQENPLLTSSILTAGAKKVGYVAYNNFSSGVNYAYDDALANTLNNFKSQGVNTLVFDVRYNSGGSVYAVQALGSALVKGRDVNKAFIQQVRRVSSSPLNFQDKTRGKAAIPTLGDNLDKIYIITGQATAGASEALINAIKAYRGSDIEVVGEKSKGRTVAIAGASENATPENPTASGKWSLRIAYSHLADFNKGYNYANGIALNTQIKEVEVAATKGILLGELGTENEVILSQILNMIKGNTKGGSVDIRSTAFEKEVKTSLSRRRGSNETTVDLVW